MTDLLTEMQNLCVQFNFQEVSISCKLDVPNKDTMWRIIFCRDEWWTVKGFGETANEAFENAKNSITRIANDAK